MFVSRPGPQRYKTSDKSSSTTSDEPVDMFATARGTVKAKRRFSHDEGVCVVEMTADNKCSIVRASSDSNIVNNNELSPQQSEHLSSGSDSSSWDSRSSRNSSSVMVVNDGS